MAAGLGLNCPGFWKINYAGKKPTDLPGTRQFPLGLFSVWLLWLCQTTILYFCRELVFGLQLYVFIHCLFFIRTREILVSISHQTAAASNTIKIGKSFILTVPYTEREKQNKRKFLLLCDYEKKVWLWEFSRAGFTGFQLISQTQRSFGAGIIFRRRQISRWRSSGQVICISAQSSILLLCQAR